MSVFLSLKRGRWLTYVLFLGLFLLLGYSREFFFVHLNNIMYMVYYQSESALKVPSFMKFFSTWDYNTLYYWKYPFTVIWTLIFLGANYLALKKLTDNRWSIRILWISYGIMFVVAGISMAYGYLVKEQLQSDEYTLSRWLMGIAQSPLLCLILLASGKLYTQSNISQRKKTASF